jgi:hypothetical protein
MACVSNGHILRTNGCLSIGFEVLDLLINLIGGVSVKSENNSRNHYQPFGTCKTFVAVTSYSTNGALRISELVVFLTGQ